MDNSEDRGGMRASGCVSTALSNYFPAPIPDRDSDRDSNPVAGATATMTTTETGRDLEALSAIIAAGLRHDLGARTFDHWLKHVRPVGFDQATGVLELSAPSAFTGEQIEKRFAERILLAWKQHLGGVHALSITASARPMVTVATLAPPLTAANAAQLPRPAHLWSVPIDSHLTFAHFVPGISNTLAMNAARRVAALESPQFNPLYLRAVTGQGKTHLLHAIAASTMSRNPAARIILMSAEKFMLEFVTI